MRGLGTDLNDARDEEEALADVDLNDREGGICGFALATGGVIPTPGMTQVPYVYYAQLYPPARWEDPVSYVQTTQTSVLAGEECTYYMDEVDEQWLDKNNRQARGENGQDKDPNIGVPISISKDEFELVMGLLEKFTDQQGRMRPRRPPPRAAAKLHNQISENRRTAPEQGSPFSVS
ncbi:hypothetical protein B0H14DRAFT_3688393 [Mycena olivaceomarginata]|nr:hypothetical protein B0H14DRAFT_3688393 [Mycena olivaceomarginata]